MFRVLNVVTDFSTGHIRVRETREVYRPFVLLDPMIVSQDGTPWRIGPLDTQSSERQLVKDWIQRRAEEDSFTSVLEFKHYADVNFIADVLRSGTIAAILDPHSPFGKQQLITNDIVDFVCYCLNLTANAEIQVCKPRVCSGTLTLAAGGQRPRTLHALD